MIAFDCQEYLETVLPALLQRGKTPRLDHPAVVQFLVTDREGCAWHYDISADRVVAGQGPSDRADLTVAMCADDLAAFSRHTLDVGRAVLSQRLKVMGDSSLLRWLAARLSAPPAN